MPGTDPVGSAAALRDDARGLVGRTAELEAIADLLAGPPDRGGALVLRGDPGIGKTTLLDAAASLAAGLGFQTLRTIGAEAESGVPYAALHTLIRPIVGLADDIPDHLRASLLAALGLADASVPAGFAVALACLEVLDRAAAQAPVCLLADDVHWLDRESLDVLGFLSRRLQADPVVLLAAGRPAPRVPSAPAADLVIGPLPGPDANALLTRRSPGLRGPTRSELLRQAAGNPLAIVELARSAPEGGAGPVAPGAALALTDRLRSAFGDRLAGLTAETRRALLVAALDPAATLVEVLEAAGAAGGRAPALGVLDAAADRGLVAVDERAVQFCHPLIRSAVLEQASPSQRQAAHGALAQAVVDPERRLWHRARATSGHDDELARALRDAARSAERRGAPALAVSHLEQSALRASAPGERAAALLEGAELAAQIGQDEEAARFVAALRPGRLTPPQRARLRLVELTLDDPLSGDARRLTDECLAFAREALGASDVAVALRLLSHAALRCWWTDPGPAARRALVAAAREIPVDRTDPRVIAILAEASPIADGEDLLDRLGAVDEAAVADADAARLLGNAAYIVGEYALGARLLDRASDRLREEGRLAPLAGVLVVRGWTAVDAGQWSLAEQAVDEGLSLAHDAGHTGWIAGARMLQALTAGLRGDADRHAERAAEAERQIHAGRSTAQLRVLRIARGTVAAVAGRHDEACALLLPLFDRDDPGFDARNTFDVIPYLADAAAQTEQGETVRRRLGELDMVLPERRPPIVRAALDYAAAVLDDDADAEARFAAALAGPARARPFDLARIQLAQGRWLRRNRRIVEAREPLRAARDAFDRLGTRPLGERAREELRAAGEATRRRGTPAWHDLSPQEAQIARLVAEGLSNREIGQRLFLSHRTVASHLYRMFPKLGITSRVELVAAGRPD